MNKSILVVGGEGLVGKGLLSFLTSHGYDVFFTSRNPNSLFNNKISLDMAADPKDWPEFSNYSYAFICAGITNIAYCEDNPYLSRKVNVTNTIEISRTLMRSGTRVIFLSSNTVFDGLTEVDEFSVVSPITEYGRQKVQVESALLGNTNFVVVRLSKVLTYDSGIVAEFIKKLKEGKCIEVFDDLKLSPISLDYLCDSLLTIAGSDEEGIFHLSGEDEISYSNLGTLLASGLDIPIDKVRSVTSIAKNINVLFRPVHPSLKMKRTSNLLAISPQPTAQFIEHMIKANH